METDKKFHYLHQITDDIDDAFKAFYDNMLVDAKLSVFFDSPEQIKQLIIKQKTHFRASIDMPIEKMQLGYVKLGEFHYDIRIPYIDFVKGTKILEEHFIIFAHKMKASEKILNEIFRFFKLMTSSTAKGYLNKLLAEDRNDIDDFFEQSLKINSFLPKQIITRKFEWIKEIIQHIENDEYSSIDIHNSILKDWLDEAEFLTTDKREFFEEIDKRLSINTQNLFYFLERKEYVEILPLYSSLLGIYKLMLMINNTMTIEHANNIIEQMKVDSLTGLYRKDIFDEILSKEYSFTKRHEDNMISIAYIDLDDFKQINDTYGHYSGDKVLEMMGETIRNNIRSSDYGFRIGGDEFAIIMKKASKENAKKVCDKILKTVAENNFIFNDETNFNVTMSIGISEFSSQSDISITDLIKDVDAKMYDSKRSGKNQISI